MKSQDGSSQTLGDLRNATINLKAVTSGLASNVALKNVSIAEDSPGVTLDQFIKTGPALADSSESVIYKVIIPANAKLTVSQGITATLPTGTSVADEISYFVSAADLTKFQVTPLANYSGSLSVKFSALSQESDGTRSVESSPQTATLVVNPVCLLYTSPSPRDGLLSRMPSSA